ncbi:MAG TPA: N-6 DNA methylase [Tenuifilaceae bacterium]|nr:N-6 DNA methylase [Tenuifilaceae bacterium]
MSLFQKSVEKKYLDELDSALIDKKFAEFKLYFGNAEIQENIRNSKEEQFQEGFLRELFVKIFDYTLNPHPNFNLTTELKNVSDSKKADGAILRNENAIAVIELKSTDTTDLGKVEAQAFGYKNHHPKCVYVITSNFEKLRFYIQNAVNHFEFDLFKLTKEEFSLLWLCLAKDNLLNDLPLKIKESSLAKEENITKQLYSDYSKFREALYQNLVKNNPEVDKLTLFKKTQKLIDRFLFIFFAEDKQLLPANSILQIIEKWKDDVDFGDVKSLYSLFRKYFHILNVGRPKSEKRQEIFAYNGGLFLTDEILENVVIDDDVLKEHTLKLSNYDFDTEVDVNILGHIFEHSLGEIENVQAEIKGENIDSQKTKRKKDGIFYTPKYITKYIVENSIGKLCEEKRNSFGIVDEEYAKGRKNRRKETIKELDEKLKKYQDWLISLTILDPACGSGAFLNQALEFLIEEHRKIDELRTQLFGGGLIFSDISTDILEKNIYGVDINEESVEIAKLSLWLRTARKGRKLNTLSNNIKCGNSLIDDPEIANEKAFNWQNEFPEIFAKGGFDVVIGNPPYGAELSGKNWLKIKFKETSFGNIDSYKYFIQLGSMLTKNNGTLSYIMPDSYLEKEYFKDLRHYVTNNFEGITNIKLGDDVFDDVNLPTSIIILHQKGLDAKYFYYKDLSNISKTDKPVSLINKLEFINENPDVEKTFVVIKSIIKPINTVPLIEVYDQVMGVKVYQTGKGNPKQTSYEIDNDVFISKTQNETFNYPFISQGINRYIYYSQNEFISYGEWLAEPRKNMYFDNPKVIIREIINPRIFATYIEEPAVVKNIAAVIIEKDDNYPLKFLLGLVNSKLLTYYINEQSPKSSNKSYPSFNSRLLKELPIIKCSENDKEEIILRVDNILNGMKKADDFYTQFCKYFSMKFGLQKLNSSLENWHELEFIEFLKELKKQKVEFSISEEVEWMNYFNEQKKKADDLKIEIASSDNEIDQLVYKLYNLSDKEIIKVEESL